MKSKIAKQFWFANALLFVLSGMIWYTHVAAEPIFGFFDIVDCVIFVGGTSILIMWWAILDCCIAVNICSRRVSFVHSVVLLFSFLGIAMNIYTIQEYADDRTNFERSLDPETAKARNSEWGRTSGNL
ncbi:hypothetical protein [Allorhodopirellula heiligendammensis]|uniref:Uncharacterized protein n=1 Tax=Allorhodopirellula heiligendammensis TaxID=2714739 RepID=A0A5C6C373_9BACT|nr:hypothetical protein [Allorhodopirellula heiligendammensis]TWU18578.1 hypothetical protein Poly21_07420 [Allorhodopirellula heiligendammensis]